MSPADVIRNAQSMDLIDENGEEIPLSLLPALTDSEIDDFAQSLPCTLPGDVRDLLRFCRGFEGVVADVVDFTGRDFLFGNETIFPHGLPIASDGYGNFWVIDLSPGSKAFAPIYFACQDAPVILYQSDSLSDFLTELFKACVPPHKNLIDDVHEDRLYDVWSANPGVIGYADCVASPDSVLNSFASDLDPSWYVIDLRNAEPGVGFSWGRYGPNTNIRRHGLLPIFAYPKRGYFTRFFGR